MFAHVVDTHVGRVQQARHAGCIDLIDGREAVTFLVRVKEAIEDPTRLLIDL